jgi:translation initiation factor IF-1
VTLQSARPSKHRRPRVAEPSSAAGAANERKKRSTVIARKRNTAPRAPKAHSTQATKEAPIEVYGSVKQVFPSTTFSVELDNGHIVLAHIAGRLRRHHIKILPGDRVDVEISPYDLTKGRIVYRYRAGEARRV